MSLGYLNNCRILTFYLVHLTALVGIFSLWNVAETFYFLLFLTTYLLGLYMDLKGFYPIRRLLLTLLGFLLSLYFLSFLSLEDLLKPFSHVVLLLLSIKSLEEKKPRDLYQILLLSLFALSISTLYNLSLSFLLIFLFHSFLGVSSLIFINLYRRVGDKRLPLNTYKSYALVSLAFFLMVLSLTFPFFFFLPRSQSPLFDLFANRGGLKTGLSDSVSLGKVGEIQEDNTVVLRAYGLPPNLGEPYWRAIVFDRYEKNTWLRVKEEALPMPRGEGDLVYTLVVEPSFDNVVPALDYPYSLLKIEDLKATPYIATGNVLRLDGEINRTIRIVVSSSKGMYLKESPEDYLQVPTILSPSLKSLAEEISRKAMDDKEKLQRVIKHFSKDYQYTLRLERHEGDPLEYFLFVSKKGNCEYYASATALLLRLMGIPARVVGGYKGALWNQFGGYHIVTNSMAHVWVEAYIEGQWVRVDTTPPYVSPAVNRVSPLALISDSIVSFWYSYVVGYSSEKQIRLFSEIGKGVKAELKLENLRKRLLHLLYLFAFFLSLYGAISLFLMLRRTPKNLFLKTRSLLASKGLVKEDALPEEILSACKDTHYYSLVKFILSLYQRHKYSPYKLYPDEIREGYRALRELRKVIRSSGRF
ncbi:MAG: transglutaminaseTgpA domain-containing protein [Aquificaceae bacterium]